MSATIGIFHLIGNEKKKKREGKEKERSLLSIEKDFKFSLLERSACARSIFEGSRRGPREREENLASFLTPKGALKGATRRQVREVDDSPRGSSAPIAIKGTQRESKEEEEASLRVSRSKSIFSSHLTCPTLTKRVTKLKSRLEETFRAWRNRLEIVEVNRITKGLFFLRSYHFSPIFSFSFFFFASQIFHLPLLNLLG